MAFHPISLSFRRLHLRSPSSPSLRPPFYLHDTLFSHRSTILSRFTAYRTRSRSLFSSRIPRQCSLPPSSFRKPPPRLAPPAPLSLSRTVAIPNLPILIYIRAITRTDYDLYVAVRRIATLPDLERPSLLIRSPFSVSRASRYFVLDDAQRTLDSRVP